VVPPFEGVSLSAASARVDSEAVRVAWRIQAAPQGWTYAGGTLSTALVALGVIDPTLPILQASRPGTSADSPSTEAQDGQVEASIPVPVQPGLYRLTVGLAETTSGRAVAAGGPYGLYVPGPRAARITAPRQVSVTAGEIARFPVVVANTGTESWADPPAVGWLPIEAQRAREIRVVGRWVRPSPTGPALPGTLPSGAGPFIPSGMPNPGAAGPVVEAALTGNVDLGELHLETGEEASLVASVRAPAIEGRWLLVFELVGDTGRSLALAGSAPGITTVDVLPADPSAGRPGSG
jgi:hypothetical protein